MGNLSLPSTKMLSFEKHRVDIHNNKLAKTIIFIQKNPFNHKINSNSYISNKQRNNNIEINLFSS